MPRSPESGVPINWRGIFNRNFRAIKAGELPNPGNMVWFRGKWWVENVGLLRQPTEEERLKIQREVTEGRINIPTRQVTKVQR